MNLLVTGGAGFIGSNFIRHTIERPGIKRLINLDCLTYAGHLENLAGMEGHPKYVFEKCDLRDKPAVLRVCQQHRVTHVMHLAAESHVDRSIEGPADFIETNIVGTFNLLECARVCWTGPGPFRFVHGSTDEVYGSLPATGLFTEQTPYAPNSPYSASKAASDLLVRAFQHTYGVPAILTHCSNNYGPQQYPEKLVPLVIQRALTRQPIPIYGDGRYVRDWIHVLDHVDALWRVLTRGRDGETYNISANCERANLEVVELLCDTVDRLQPRLGGNSRKLITLAPDRPGHDRRYAMDASRIRTELGWAPEKKFEEGILETVTWYLANQEWVQAVTRGKERN